MRAHEFLQLLNEKDLSFKDFQNASEARWDIFLNRVANKQPWEGKQAPTLGGESIDYLKDRAGSYPYNIYIGFANPVDQQKLLKSIEAGHFAGYVKNRGWYFPVYNPTTGEQLDHYSASWIYKDPAFGQQREEGGIANYGNLSEPLAGAGLTAKFLKRVTGGVEPIEVKDIFEILSKLKVDPNTIEIDSEELHEENVVYASAEYQSTLKDKIIWKISTQEQTYRELLEIAQGGHRTDKKLLGQLEAIVNYCNSRLLTRYSRFFATNRVVDEIIVDTDGIGGAASLQSGEGTKADLFVIANGKKLRYANISLKAGNKDIGQHALVSAPRGRDTQDPEKIKEHLWSKAVTLWQAFDDGSKHINIESDGLFTRDSYLESVGITDEMNAEEIMIAIDKTNKGSLKTVRNAINNMFTVVKNEIQEKWLNSDSSKAEYNFLKAVIQFIEFHGAREDGVELVDFNENGNYSVHSFKDLEQKLDTVDLNVYTYKTSSGNAGFVVYDSNSVKNNKITSGSTLFRLYFQPRAGSGQGFKVHIVKGPLLSKLTDVTEQRKA